MLVAVTGEKMKKLGPKTIKKTVTGICLWLISLRKSLVKKRKQKVKMMRTNQVLLFLLHEHLN